jgi:protocatechuate 3,4-dioxygenase, alpha subunit
MTEPKPSHAPQTSSQTVGPYFNIGMKSQNNLRLQNPAGQAIEIHGQVFDGAGVPVPDALLEIWQSDANGIFAHPTDPNHKKADPNFFGFGRCHTNQNGEYRFLTILPGSPFIVLRFFARGLLIHAVSRIYFADRNNSADGVYAQLSPAQQKTLLALPLGNNLYRFDVRLQGADETVFFEV